MVPETVSQTNSEQGSTGISGIACIFKINK